MSRPAKNNIVMTADRARQLLVYDPESGNLTWRSKGSNKAPVVIGAKAGHFNSRGYGVIYLDNRQYRMHRVIWLYMTGRWPDQLIDHVNCNPSDNRWTNLRAATYAINSQNRRRSSRGSTSNLLGASLSSSNGKWQAAIRAGGKTHFLGWFNTDKEAHHAYVKAKRSLHAGCTL